MVSPGAAIVLHAEARGGADGTPSSAPAVHLAPCAWRCPALARRCPTQLRIITIFAAVTAAVVRATALRDGACGPPPCACAAYVQDQKPSIRSRAKVVFIHYAINCGSHKPSRVAIPLEEAASPFVPGLQVTSRAGTKAGATPLTAERSKSALVVGTIRMGFGHHRIAYAAASWGVASGRTTYFHDLLNIDSPEATMIKEMDKGYSQMSRLATEMGGMVEQLWGSLTRGADENMLRASYQFAENLLPLLLSYPKDTPIITTHCFVGLIAVALGFTKVINLVIDNHAQWFIVVPGAYNLVQGPSNYHNLLRMGVPPNRLMLAGHWIPKDLVDGVEKDCADRIARANARQPTRLLIPVGGAGAQKTFVTTFIKSLRTHVVEGKVCNLRRHARGRQWIQSRSGFGAAAAWGARCIGR